MNNIVIVTGCPGTGKSHWTRLLTGEFPELSVFSYDELKERYFDLFGFDNLREKLENTERSLEAYYRELDRRMAGGEDLLIEYPFNMRHAPVIAGSVLRHGYSAVTVYLHGRMDVVYARSLSRDRGGARHPGHLLSRYHLGETEAPAGADAEVFLTFEQFSASCAKKNYDIRLGFNIPVDVTDFEGIDYETVFSAIQSHTTLRRIAK